MNITLAQLVDLAKEAEAQNPIEWGELPLDEDTVYNTFALAIYKIYALTNPKDRDLILLASLIKLNVENLVLKQQQAVYMNTISELQTKKG